MADIQIRGAKTHNLKNIDVDLPRDKLIVITGLSGSGKSSLAFDTIYAEGQRKYVESLSAYARQFLSMMEKPDVDSIEGLSPAISIEQKTTSHNPRSTVGTVTEVYDYLRLLFARTGTPHCPTHNLPLEAQTVSQMVDHTLELPEETRLMLLAPMIRGRKGQHKNVFEQLQAQGYIRVRVDGRVLDIDEALDMELDGKKKHTIEAVVDRFKVREDLKLRLAESFETTLELADGLAIVAPMNEGEVQELIFSAKYACPECGYSISELEPKLFSFNSPSGACPTCEGLGVETFFDPDKIIINPSLSLEGGVIRGWDKRNAYYFAMITSLAKHTGFKTDIPFNELSKEQQDAVLHGTGIEAFEMTFPTPNGKKTVFKAFEGIIPNMKRRYLETDSQAVREELSKYQASRSCPSCQGTRLNQAARHVLVDEKNLPELVALPVEKSTAYFSTLTLDGAKGQIAEKIIKEIHDRLRFLNDVGLGYLSLNRSAETLSGGEAQRIRLASQIGSGLVGVMYILDEPSIGLHQRDNDRLLATLTHLRDLGNTVIVVEHDEDAIRAADYVLDIGPGAGVHGGQIIAHGTPDDVKNHPDSLTGKYLSGIESIALPKIRRNFEQSYKLYGASGNNLNNVDVEIPVGVMTCITGVSGSGKSTLINETVYKHLANKLNRASHQVSAFEKDENIEAFDKVVEIDQSPIGRTPRSNPATYTGLFTHIRELFSGTAESRSRGYKPGRFSFNVKGGRCEACQGDGVVKVEMHFLADVYVPCDVCKGKRYNRETLDVQYKGKNIYEVLDLTIEEAADFFAAVPAIANKLNTLIDVGLTYIKLGQSATTLSGGEAQRVKLARELSKRDTGKTIYILDEPTTGLHFHDVKLLLSVLNRLVERGNTVVVIEHNLDVIKTADWVIDLGPEGGSGGGQIVACGTPETVSAQKTSHTGQYLTKLLS